MLSWLLRIEETEVRGCVPLGSLCRTMQCTLINSTMLQALLKARQKELDNRNQRSLELEQQLQSNGAIKVSIVDSTREPAALDVQEPAAHCTDTFLRKVLAHSPCSVAVHTMMHIN